MNAKQCKKLRRQAREFAEAGKLPERQMIGGTHRFELRDVAHDGKTEQKLFFVPSQALNERYTQRGVYRALKRDARRAA